MDQQLLTKFFKASYRLSCRLVKTNVTSNIINLSKVSKQKTLFLRTSLAFRLTGQVKWFHACKGYVFIHNNDLDSDVSIHYSFIIKIYPRL